MFGKLKELQQEHLRVQNALAEEIKRVLHPLLLNCKTSDEVLTLREEAVKEIGDISGLIGVKFAIFWASKE